jgi:hypothetical protein
VKRTLKKRVHIIRKKNTDNRGKTDEDQVGFQKLPTYNTLNKIIQKTPNAEIPKGNFSLLRNPLVLFNRIFRG